MKNLFLLLASILVACQQTGNNKAQSDTLSYRNDSIVPVERPADSLVGSGTPSTVATDSSLLRAGKHPITLQWISWDKPGTAELMSEPDGWFTITGTQSNAEGDRLTIEGKIRRIGPKELEFFGRIETVVQSINAGEPCVRNGRQRFYAKGTRKYYRMQQMENCGGGNVLDYVDIHPGTSGL
jgi:hypothetical protein